MEKQSKIQQIGAVDRSSRDLPDSVIQHILSFLPTTRDAIRTSLLSKSWKNQWRRVPVLIFHKNLECINNVLNQFEGLKLEKFCISATFDLHQADPHLDHNTIRFALDRHVKELILQFHHLSSSRDRFSLPEFLFSYAFLVRLQTCFCTFQPNEKVNWIYLKEFSANECVFPDRAIDNILSGCPLLESLGLKHSDFDRLVIASKTLRKLALVGVKVSYFGISCPRLEEFRLSRLNYERPLVDDGTVLCSTVSLTVRGEFVVASECMKKLVLKDLQIYYLEIACPLLEQLELLHIIYLRVAKVGNLPCLNSTTLNLDSITQSKEILLQFQHVKELTLRRQFIMTLVEYSKVTKGAALLTLQLTNKCLILDYPNSDGIALAIHCFYALEKLVIKLPIEDAEIEDSYWSSDALFYNCSTSKLRIVQLNGLQERDDCCKGALNFVEFLLKNAQKLEKLTVTIEDCSSDFLSVVSRKILSFQWCSQHSMVELLHRQMQVYIKEAGALTENIQLNS